MRADNTFAFKSLRFEAPRHLPERTIQVRCERRHPTQRVIIYYLLNHDPKRLITPVVNRTLHTYHNTLRILCEAFQIEFAGTTTAANASWSRKPSKTIAPASSWSHH